MSDYKFPCKECTSRYIGCHSKCEGYIKAKAENDALNSKINKKKVERDEYIAFRKYCYYRSIHS